MRALFVHPGPLLYTKVFLRLEPLGLELVAQAARRAGHEVKLIDLQVEAYAAYHRLITEWRPDFVAFSCNYLANVPEIIDLAKESKTILPRAFICVGGHSASFTANAIVDHSAGAIDCVLRGEGEAGIVPLLEAIAGDRAAVAKAPGAVTLDGEGPPPRFVDSVDELLPARDLVHFRHKYFIGILDPAASIEFSRGCPWDCSFCSAWTFYGRSYRLVSPERVLEDLQSIREGGVFIVDDVAFVHEEHGFAIGELIAKKGVHKKYYLETRGDVLLRSKEVFKFWKSIGMKYMFLGIEAIDDDGLHKFRKRVPLGRNFEALEFARSLGIEVAINLIADPDWDKQRFAAVRDWCMNVPEIVNISVNTPYPGTESWVTEERRLATRDYRLFDIQHAVLPTRLPLREFYDELLTTQRVLYNKHLSWRTAPTVMRNALSLLMRGRLNFVRGMLLYNRTYNLDKMLGDHIQPVKYEIPAPPPATEPANIVVGGKAVEPLAKSANLYVHAPRGRTGRSRGR
jgi:magnesium-protoporphyrin IX monomethyl ester (oxidative) cyclase